MTIDQQIEIWGLILGLLTPLAIVAIGFFLNKRIKHVEATIEKERTLTETRFSLYQDIALQLNDLYAYFDFRGYWKDLSCADVIERKRKLDRHLYAYRPIFSEAFFEKYLSFTNETFKTNTGWGRDAMLRTETKHRKEKDDAELLTCFTEEDNRENIRAAHEALMNCLAAELNMSPNSNGI